MQLDPEGLDAWYNKGVALSELGRDTEAEKCFVEFHKRHSDFYSKKRP